MKNYFIYFIALICFLQCQSQDFESEHKLVILVSNENQVNTNVGTGVDLKTMSRLDWETIDVSDTIYCPINKYRKLYIRNENSFFSIYCQTGDTLEINVSLKKTDYSFRNRTKKKYDNQNLDQLLLKDQNIKLVLDSLFEEKLLSLPDYEYNISKFKSDEFNKYIKGINELNKDVVLKQLNFKYFKNDSLILDDFAGYIYVSSLVRKLILKNEKKISKTKIVIDYKRAFNELPNYVEGLWLKYAQFYCLINMGQDSPPTEVNSAIKIFDKRFNDSILTERIKSHPFLLVQQNKISLDFEKIKKEIDKTYFINADDEKTTLMELVKKNHGKVLYIDFWASWCIPCRNEMPNSKLLSEKFKGENVIFLYFSIDKSLEAWQKASKFEKLPVKQSFLAINYPGAKFYKDLKLKSIPRYLLFNKKGILINESAPRPSDKRIIKLINSLLEN